MRPSPRSIAETFRPHKHVVAAPQVPRANGVSKLAEAGSWLQSTGTRAKYEAYQKAAGEHEAAKSHLDQIHSLIATHTQLLPSDVRGIHSDSATTAGNIEGALKEKHEANLARLPAAAHPVARLHLDHLIKHAKFMHGVVRTSGEAVEGALSAMSKP